jgi:hypothetical protein
MRGRRATAKVVGLQKWELFENGCQLLVGDILIRSFTARKWDGSGYFKPGSGTIIRGSRSRHKTFIGDSGVNI